MRDYATGIVIGGQMTTELMEFEKRHKFVVGI